MVKISVNVDDVGVYKLNRIAPFFEINSATINKILEINFIRKFVSKLLYAREFKQIIKIKKIARKYKLPVSWAIVPFEHGVHSEEKRFDIAFPEMYSLIKKWVKEGDEVIQHGTYHKLDEFKGMHYEEQKERLEKGWKALSTIFPGMRKIIQLPKWSADENTIKALQELEYEAVLAANVIGLKVKPLKTTMQIILTKVPLDKESFDEEAINLILHPNHKQAIKELDRWLKFSKDFKDDCEYIKTSECLI
ncbi:DUF2334 domain-containing protein [Candidatus Woesearchaeota archaeon]|nr:DUF2334 domain-containing protein [Candidatus Woesearchaeota archaeon]